MQGKGGALRRTRRLTDLSTPQENFPISTPPRLPQVEIINADCLAALCEMADESVDCVVTSPPYWGLRDYGVEGAVGLEPTLQEHIAALVAIFREVRRVLKKTGTCWINYGDAYAGSTKGGNPGDSPHTKQRTNVGSLSVRNRRQDTPDLKAKDRMGLPHRLVFALQDDGWWWRDEIVWHKPNPMPSSVKDRSTPAHEFIFLLTKAPRYFFDQEAWKEPVSDALIKQVIEGYNGADTKDYAAAKAQSASGTKSRIIEQARKKIKVPGGWDKGNGAHGTIHRSGRTEALYAEAQMALTRDKRSVWTVSPNRFKEAHFATFPPALIEPCIVAGCPQGGLVLDPFGGAGTTALVARDNGRDCVLIELNASYCGIARRRLAGEQQQQPSDDDLPNEGIFA